MKTPEKKGVSGRQRGRTGAAAKASTLTPRKGSAPGRPAASVGKAKAAAAKRASTGDAAGAPAAKKMDGAIESLFSTQAGLADDQVS